MHLGPILRSEEDGNYHLRHVRPLPPNMTYATGQIRQLTPSLFCVILWFLCDETSTSRFANILRTEYTTYAKHYTHGIAFPSPENQKTDKIDAIRLEHDTHITLWFRQYLPGLFSFRQTSSLVTTAEFIVTKNVQPFPSASESNDSEMGHLRVLKLFSSWDVWRIESIKSLRIHFSERRLYGNTDPSVIAIEDEDLNSIAKRMNYGSSATRILCIEDHISDALCLQGIVSLLDSYAATVREIRESGVFGSKSKRTVLRRLRELSDGVSSSADIMTVSSELGDYVDSPFFGANLKSFRPCQPALYGSGHTLVEQMRTSVRARTKWLLRAEESLRTHLTQHGTLLGGRENLVLTWLVVVLTLIVLLFTVISQYEPILGVWKKLLALTGHS